MSRALIKGQHEAAVLEHFLDWFNGTSASNFAVVDRPEPPDALIADGKILKWVEVTTAYVTRAYAKDLHSFANPDEEHIPIPEKLFVDPHVTSARNFCGILQKKLESESYREYFEQYGPGYLVVDVKDPFFDQSTISMMKRLWSEKVIEERKFFSNIFYFHPHLRPERYLKWE